MIFFKQDKPDSEDWLYNAQLEFSDFIKTVEPKLIELNQKYFKKDTGFRLVNGKNKEGKIKWVTHIDGLGEIPEYFYKAFRQDLILYMQDKSTYDALAFLDALREDILKESKVIQ